MKKKEALTKESVGKYFSGIDPVEVLTWVLNCVDQKSGDPVKQIYKRIKQIRAIQKIKEE